MDSDPDPRVALLSLHPEWAQAILDGRKTVEFRRSVPVHDVSHVVIYATKPVGQVVGYFKVASVVSGSPTSLWMRFGAQGAISRTRFRSYFRSKSTGYAIEVGEVVRLKRPVDLEHVADVRPPQNFCYLPVSTLNISAA
jgi:predicted transcriptional regulator